MASVVETVSQVYASVSILGIVCLESRQYPQLNARSISVFLYRADDLDCHVTAPFLVCGLDDFAEGPLAELFTHSVCVVSAVARSMGDKASEELTSICEVTVRYDNVMSIVVVNLGVFGVGNLRCVSAH